MTLHGKTAFVAGASRGIGATVAAALAREGAAVAVAARSEQLGKLPGTIGSVAAAITESGGRALPVPCDVTSEESVNAAVEAAVAEFGGIDILVANAGVLWLGPIESTPLKRWQLCLDVNLTGVFLTTRRAGQEMARRGGGAIVVFASTNAFFAEELNVPYSATKGGIVMFVRNAALDLARHRIRINAVDPGIIHTRLSAALIEDPVAGPEYLRRIPAGRYGTPEDIAKVVLFLASDDAAYMTGEDVIVDGGATLGVSLGIEDLGLKDAAD